MKIGAHLSGGVSILTTAENAVEFGFDAVQVFLNSPTALTFPKLPKDIISRYCKDYGHLETICHGPFVLSLANDVTVNDNMVVKYLSNALVLCHALGSKHYVVHCGGNPKGPHRGMKAIRRRVLAAIKKTPYFDTIISLETTSGGGTKVGRFSQLRALVSELNHPRVKMTVDTAHMYADGYNLERASVCRKLLPYKDLIDVIHLNDPDCNVKLGGHLDRHNCVFGQGGIGVNPLAGIAIDFCEKIIIVECRSPDIASRNVDIIKARVDEVRELPKQLLPSS